MRSMKLALLRALSSKGLTVLLLLCAALPPLASECVDRLTNPAAGYICPPGCAEEICAYLDENGFTRYDSAELLRRDVEYGVIDCGAVIPGDISERLSSGELTEAIVFIQSPMSLTPEMWRGHLSAAVFAERAPYISAETLGEMGVGLRETIDTYDAMMEEGLRFDFDIEYTSADSAQDSRLGRSLAMLCLGCIVSVTVMFGVCLPALRDTRLMLTALGRGAAVKTLLWPQLALRGFLVWLCASLGAALCGMPEISPALACFTLCSAAIGLLLNLRRWGSGALSCFAALNCASACLLCPVFTDISAVLPVIGSLRYLNSIYWLWCFADSAYISLAASAAAAALLAMAARLNSFR